MPQIPQPLLRQLVHAFCSPRVSDPKYLPYAQKCAELRETKYARIVTSNDSFIKNGSFKCSICNAMVQVGETIGHCPVFAAEIYQEEAMPPVNSSANLNSNVIQSLQKTIESQAQEILTLKEQLKKATLTQKFGEGSRVLDL